MSPPKIGLSSRKNMCVPSHCAKAFALLSDAIESDEDDPFYSLMILCAALLLAKSNTRAKVLAVINELERHGGGAS